MLNILHLEDDPLDKELIDSILLESSLSYTIDCVNSKKSYSIALKSKKYDLILSDYNLPDFDGLSALKTAQKICRNTKFIFVSGVLEEELAIESLTHGATDYVYKSNLSRLIPAVKRARDEIEKRKKLEEKERNLKQSEEKYRSLVDSAPSFIMTSDRQGVIQFINHVYPTYTQEEIIGSSLLNYMDQSSQKIIKKAIQSVLSSGEVSNCVIKSLSKEGGIHWHSTYIGPIYKDHDICELTIISHDITERRENELRLQKQQLLLSHFSRINIFGEIASGIAHQLNQPLTIITQYLGGCIERIKKTYIDPTVISVLKKAMQQVVYAGEIINNIKNFLQKGVFEKSPVKIDEVIEETLDLIKYQLEDSQINLIFNKTEEEPPFVSIEKVQIQQVFLNIIQNAISAMMDKAVKKRELKITIRHGADSVLIAFMDSGKGITKENINKLFDHFFSTKEDGMGIGLTISHAIVEAHDGEITVASEVGKSTTFTIRLPI